MIVQHWSTLYKHFLSQFHSDTVHIACQDGVTIWKAKGELEHSGKNPETVTKWPKIA